jgi:hypothetical protein
MEQARDLNQSQRRKKSQSPRKRKSLEAHQPRNKRLNLLKNPKLIRKVLVERITLRPV